MSPDLEFHAPSIEELQPHFPAYEITAFIAQGGMGAVYAARQVSLDRPVAIKILPRQFGADPQFRTSFESEAKSMARLNHPNLIGVYDFGDADGMLYIIMELVEGKSLFHSAHGKTIDQEEAARLVAGISHGLAHAHQHGILHRDIKPGNILLGPGAVPKIGDFGLARPVGEGHNPDEIVWGTPGYSAPEVVNDPGEVDQRADIFAVGVLLYELLTAQVPTETWQPPSAVVQCRPEFDAIIRRATHPSRKMRYADAEKLAKELDELGENIKKPVLRRPKPTPPSTPTPGASPMGVRPVTPALSPPARSQSIPVVGILVVLGVLGVIGFILLGSGKGKERSEVTDSLEQPLSQPKPRPSSVTKTPQEKEEKPAPRPADPEPPKPEPVESTSQALARLKARLKAGDLSELPKGAVKRGDSHFLLVTEALPWQAASYFAEGHGAQLATLPAKDDLSWAVSELKIGSPAWIGLSDSGMEGKWYWVNGEAPGKDLWAAGQPDESSSPDGGQDYAALLPDHSLDDFAASRNLPFLLQWGQGDNEGSIARQLERVAASLKAKQPIFPAGTQNINGSRFLVVPESVSWRDAYNMAQASGGHLAVPSNNAEATWIIESMQKLLEEGDGCWIGGSQKGVATPIWTFVTGERFDFITWAPGQPGEGTSSLKTLQLWRGEDREFGYRNVAGEPKEAGYFLVEWSAPSRRNMPVPWLVKFRQLFRDQEEVSHDRWKRRH
ncbi:MAG: protein kinase, partial [Roseibacillus sp.]|nr:protein kinase [Roseibacillus sp.]